MNPLTRAWAGARNSLDFALRQVLTWSPPAPAETDPDDEAPTEREAAWIDRYGLGPARARMAAWRWGRNLAVLELAEAAAAHPALGAFLSSPGPVRVLDIGSKNFDYVDALAAFASQGGRRAAEVTGLEIDPHRRYTDLRTRRAWAESYAAAVPGARYLGGDLLDHRGSYDLVTWFFPFVFEGPLLKWGLPRRHFRPRDLLKHALGLVAPGGALVIVNLTAAEAQAQHGLLNGLGAAFADLGPVPGSYSPRAGDQRLTVVLQPLDRP